MTTPEQREHLILILLTTGQLLREGGKGWPDLHRNGAFKTAEVGFQEGEYIAVGTKRRVSTGCGNAGSDCGKLTGLDWKRISYCD